MRAAQGVSCKLLRVLPKHSVSEACHALAPLVLATTLRRVPVVADLLVYVVPGCERGSSLWFCASSLGNVGVRRRRRRP